MAPEEEWSSNLVFYQWVYPRAPDEKCYSRQVFHRWVQVQRGVVFPLKHVFHRRVQPRLSETWSALPSRSSTGECTLGSWGGVLFQAGLPQVSLAQGFWRGVLFQAGLPQVSPAYGGLVFPSSRSSTCEPSSGLPQASPALPSMSFIGGSCSS